MLCREQCFSLIAYSETAYIIWKVVKGEVVLEMISWKRNWSLECDEKMAALALLGVLSTRFVMRQCYR